MFHRIVSIINIVFALALAAGFGLTCYYYVWISSWAKVAKVFAIIGFSLCGLISGGFCGFLAMDTWYSASTLCKESVEMGIIGILICGVIPGVLYLVACGVDGEEISSGSKYRSGGTSSSYDDDTSYKEDVPEYDPDQDPSVIKVEPRDVDQAPKKRLVR